MYIIFSLPLTHSVLLKCTMISWASLLLLKYFVILGLDGDNTYKKCIIIGKCIFKSLHMFYKYFMVSRSCCYILLIKCCLFCHKLVMVICKGNLK